MALIIELIAGYPQWLVNRIGHPVIWMGGLIDHFDRKFNRPDQPSAGTRKAGMVCLLVLVIIALIIALAVVWLAGLTGFETILVALAAAPLIAQRSLSSHVGAVANAISQDGLDAGRAAVGRIVGRDTAELDESGISRAAIESLAENFSDGIVAPVFWLAVAGLPGIVVYKTINTADSMIGHKSDKHVDFGRATARIDDLVNLPASRLTALLVVAIAFFMPGASGRNAWGAVWRDARLHRSPNAGWPEAAFAGALGLELAGPRRYGDEVVDDAVMGKGGRPVATAADIRRALSLYWAADVLMICLFGAAASLIVFHG